MNPFIMKVRHSRSVVKYGDCRVLYVGHMILFLFSTSFCFQFPISSDFLMEDVVARCLDVLMEEVLARCFMEDFGIYSSQMLSSSSFSLSSYY